MEHGKLWGRKCLDRIVLIQLRADWDIGYLETWKEGILKIGKRVKKEMWKDTKDRFCLFQNLAENMPFLSSLLLCVAFFRKTPNLA